LESTTDRYKIHSKKNMARVRVYYQSLEFEFIKEEVGYGTIDLLCDVGGTLSLLMGASLLTCCELFEVAWIYIVQKCCTPVSNFSRKSIRRFSHHSSKGSMMTMTSSKARGNLDCGSCSPPTLKNGTLLGPGFPIGNGAGSQQDSPQTTRLRLSPDAVALCQVRSNSFEEVDPHHNLGASHEDVGLQPCGRSPTDNKSVVFRDELPPVGGGGESELTNLVSTTNSCDPEVARSPRNGSFRRKGGGRRFPPTLGAAFSKPQSSNLDSAVTSASRRGGGGRGSCDGSASPNLYVVSLPGGNQQTPTVCNSVQSSHVVNSVVGGVGMQHSTAAVLGNGGVVTSTPCQEPAVIHLKQLPTTSNVNYVTSLQQDTPKNSKTKRKNYGSEELIV